MAHSIASTAGAVSQAAGAEACLCSRSPLRSSDSPLNSRSSSVTSNCRSFSEGTAAAAAAGAAAAAIAPWGGRQRWEMSGARGVCSHGSENSVSEARWRRLLHNITAHKYSASGGAAGASAHYACRRGAALWRACSSAAFCRAHAPSWQCHRRPERSVQGRRIEGRAAPCICNSSRSCPSQSLPVQQRTCAFSSAARRSVSARVAYFSTCSACRRGRRMNWWSRCQSAMR